MLSDHSLWLILVLVKEHYTTKLGKSEKNYKRVKRGKKLTLPCMSRPAATGASKPARFAVQFVKLIRIPANRGEISK